jgi:histidinol-phosphatase (PHP family)
MEETCAQAVRLGLPAVAFTEHADHTRWRVAEGSLDDFPWLVRLVDDRTVVAPPLDADGYFECLERCRQRFPGLRVVSGVELGEPHWHRAAASALLQRGQFDRVLGSLHCLRSGADKSAFAETADLYRDRDPAEVVRAYLEELPRLIDGFGDFAVLAHIDYVIREWPEGAAVFDPAPFEDEFRHALHSLADSGRALEVNTRGPLNAEIVQWWRDEGGDAVSFGSDAHHPRGLARSFAHAAAMVEASGFRSGRHPYDF